MLSDEQIIRQVLKGDYEGYRELVQRHQGAIYCLAYRMLNRAEEAEDVVQEAFVRAYSNLSKFRDRARFAAWIRRIAVNLCLARLPREIPSEDVESMLDAGMSRDDLVQAEVILRMERGRVREAIAKLPADYRTAITLRYEEDMPYDKIADLLHEPVSRIQVRMHRAKKMLAQRLAVMLEDAV